MLQDKIKEYLRGMEIKLKGEHFPNSSVAHDIAEICEKEDAYWKREFKRVADNYEKIWIDNVELQEQIKNIKTLNREEVSILIEQFIKTYIRNKYSFDFLNSISRS